MPGQQVKADANRSQYSTDVAQEMGRGFGSKDARSCVVQVSPQWGVGIIFITGFHGVDLPVLGWLLLADFLILARLAGGSKLQG